MSINVRARFPLGVFSAARHDGEIRHRRKAEWPPHPTRVAGAILSGAHRSGDPEVVAAAERLFQDSPPSLVVPHFDAKPGRRGEKWRRWVPTQQMEADYTKNGFIDKLDKDPEPGTYVGDRPVLFKFEGSDDDTQLINTALQHIQYLGRPTSPVVMDVVSDAEYMELSADSSYERWTPDMNGSETLDVPTGDQLSLFKRAYATAALEERAGAVGATRSVGVRPQHRYTVNRNIDAPAEVRPDADALAMTKLSVRYLEVSGFESDVASVSATVSHRLGDRPVVPVRSGQRLIGLWVFEAIGLPDDLGAIPVVAGGVLREAREPATRARPLDANVLLKRLTSRAEVWETLTPLSRDTALTPDMFPGEAVGAITTITDDRPDLLHARVTFRDAVSGPMVVGGAVFQPATSRAE